MGLLYSDEPLEKHHTIPLKQGDTNQYGNLVWLHKMCHQSIGTKEVENADLI
jgi:5-methylcytosine-specific restriction endonuclease McrA